MTMNENKKYHEDYYLGPVGMTEHNDWRQSEQDPKNQRPAETVEAVHREPIHVSDETLREKIENCFAQDPNVDAGEIEVTVQHGEVILSGTVTSRWLKQKVFSEIAEIAGVKDVDNRLSVDRPAGREVA